jgi:hypothetical protein
MSMMRAVTMCTVLLLASTLAVRAESGKQGAQHQYVKPAAAELIKITPVIPAANQQQGNNQQGQFPPGQGPNNANLPPPAQGPADAGFSKIPDAEEARPEHFEAAQEAAGIIEQLETLRPDGVGLDLDGLNADDVRRNRGEGVNPDELGLRPRDQELDAAAEALRGLTEGLGSNSDNQSEQTRSYGSVIQRDPQSMMNSARSGRASDTVSTGQGNVGFVKTVGHSDGSRTETYHRDDDGHTQDITTEYGSDGVIKTQTTVERTPDGHVSTRTAERQVDGTYWNTQQTRNRDGSGRQTDAWRGPAPNVNVDPDSAYGQGGGWVPGKKPKTILEKATDARTPGGRPPAEGQAVGGGPRLNVDVDLAGQPNPDEAAGGSAVGTFRNPNDDTVDPPRPDIP